MTTRGINTINDARLDIRPNRQMHLKGRKEGVMGMRWMPRKTHYWHSMEEGEGAVMTAMMTFCYLSAAFFSFSERGP